MHDPATDNEKSSGSVHAASGPPAPAAKLNPIQGVFVAEKDAHGRLRARFVPVATGITGTTDIEVLSGLNPGQEVVTGPYKTLHDLKGGSLLKRDTEKPVTITSNES
jgi:HlyD family secretion protein